MLGFGLLLMATILAPASASQVPAPAPPPPDNPQKPDKSPNQHIDWAASYDAALQMASEQHKPVMADFYADWTTASHYLDDHILNSPDVIKESRKFINVRINTDKQTSLTNLYKVHGIPTVIFMDGNGNVLTRIEGAPAEISYFVGVMKKAMQKFEAENKTGSGQQ